MTYTPNQLLFDKVFLELSKIDINVIDIKDLMQVIPYPFIMLDKFKIQRTEHTLNAYQGICTGAIHLWNTYQDVGQHDQYIMQIDNILSNITLLEDYQLRLLELNINTINDDSTEQALLHTIIQVEYEIL